MTYFAVDPTQMSSIVEEMSRFDTRIEAQLAHIQARIDRLHARWSGPAATAHRETHARWVAGADEMRQALATMRSIADTANANYTGAAATNVQMWSL